ncbi:glycosyltransferase family 2 protein, partial [Chromobacterium violaceum]|uniref:glycosyltransferase family 2 protein n=2 Tax=Chromobacterium violaceum TaxID=536 RepID=UPI0035E76D2D
ACWAVLVRWLWRKFIWGKGSLALFRICATAPSDDSTVDLITAQTALDSRVRIVQLADNMGTYAAKLIGLSQARGEFVTCQDSDDWAHPEKIERQLAPLLQDEQLVCTVSNWVRMRSDGSFYSRMVYPLTRLNPSSPLFRRQRVVETTGAWDCVRTGADSEFLARLKLVFGPNAVKKINQPLVLGSHRPDSLMTASATGYSTSGVSRPRLAYWESWNRWHIHCLAAGRVPMMSLNRQDPAMSRPFVAPEALQICAQSIPAELYQKIIANYPLRHDR